MWPKKGLIITVAKKMGENFVANGKTLSVCIPILPKPMQTSLKIQVYLQFIGLYLAWSVLLVKLLHVYLHLLHAESSRINLLIANDSVSNVQAINQRWSQKVHQAKKKRSQTYLNIEELPMIKLNVSYFVYRRDSLVASLSHHPGGSWERGLQGLRPQRGMAER